MLGTANYLLPEGWGGGQSEDSWHSLDIEMNERGGALNYAKTDTGCASNLKPSVFIL